MREHKAKEEQGGGRDRKTQGESKIKGNSVEKIRKWRNVIQKIKG